MNQPHPEIDSARLELVHDLATLTFVDADYLPEDLSGDRYAVLQADVEKHGQIEPVNVTPDNDYSDGRARVQISRELGRPLLIRRMTAKEAEHAALASILRRHPTVLDQVRVVAWVTKTKFPGRQKRGEGKKRDLVSSHLVKTLGWRQGTSPRQVGQYLRLAAELDKLTPQQLGGLRRATTLSEALLEAFPPDYRPLPTAAQRTGKAIERVVKLLDEPGVVDANVLGAAYKLMDLVTRLSQQSTAA